MPAPPANRPSPPNKPDNRGAAVGKPAAFANVYEVSGVPCADLSDRLVTRLFQPNIGWPPKLREVNGSEASHHPDNPEISLGKTPPSEPLPPEVEVRSACQSAIRPAPMFIGRPGATNATPTLGHRERRCIDSGEATIRSLHPCKPGAGNCWSRNVCAPYIGIDEPGQDPRCGRNG